jgi:L-methionine (R)-S-oxide reductase
MAESILITATEKEEKYRQLFPQLRALLEGEPDLIASMANTSAALAQAMRFFWVGFYIVRNEELVLGPFQGPVACVRIKKGKGVCGTSWEQEKTLVVPNVDKFPGHIACSAQSKSEIVVPVFSAGGRVIAVLDADSERLDDLDHIDKDNLEKICALLRDKQLN